ncbi:orotate phosphoribosyltransferase [Desulfuribacillus stibiiarsenatis]|uniref:Orotate phosphoribosyltransferase n=1 Tax=Desulfuribacillus stibiiarsenatis TaxID=1390249 RepID=A0A1E5L3P8_9FIRM|nr:orotate phosphoribosyltransferase [Desulfuribacillus stibiiarsenatis]OEH84737.1 orotate phosphoribosyltransferase [Desulfuribacillus stibiiarsenatis]
MLTQDQILTILKETNVLQTGHFNLTSGKHSGQYMQCAQVLQYPDKASQLCNEFVEYIKNQNLQVDLVIGPATGGIILAFETARILGTKTMFAERENGKMVFRRGFFVEPGQKVFVVEDVITTGGSVKEVVEIVKEQGGEVVGVGVLVNRSPQEVDFGAPLISLLKINIETYDPAQCPLCAQGVEMKKPGSRGLK